MAFPGVVRRSGTAVPSQSAAAVLRPLAVRYVSFTALCPCGNPGAQWMQGSDKTVRVDCTACMPVTTGT